MTKTAPYGLNIKESLELLNNKQLSSVELTSECISRISKLDPQIHAFLSSNNQALAEAKQADEMREEGSKLPLLGIPIAVKDNFLTHNLTTTASSRVLENFVPQYDATVVAKLKSAGAIILGKTNMDAWAHGSSTETSDFGPTSNPWNTNHLPGGSSGGSAAAVAADMCTAAIGSETAGSIRQPAAWCGVTGFKPTYGRVSRYGVVAMASSTDSPGPITKNVMDASILGQVIAGKDRFDATTSPKDVPNWSGSLVGWEQKVKKLRIGLAVDYLLPEMGENAKQLIKDATLSLEKFGIKVEEVKLIDPHYSIGVYTIVQRSEVSSNLARYDGIRFGNNRDTFGDEAKRRIMLGTYTLSAGYYDQFYNKAQKVRTLIIEDFKKAFRDVDVIVGPTSPGPALKVGASLDQPMFGEMEDVLVEPSSIAGLTGLSVPCGFVEALPIGLQIIADQFEEEKALLVSHAFQNITNWHTRRPSL